MLKPFLTYLKGQTQEKRNLHYVIQSTN